MLGELFSIIAPVFVCAGLGFGWARAGKPYDTELVTTLVTLLGTPCLVFATLTTVEIRPGAVADFAGATAAVFAVVMAVGFVVLKVLKLSVRAFLPALLFPNSGNMGLPLCLLAFGETGLALAIAYFTVAAVGQFTVGIALASGTLSPKKLATNPILYAVAAAVAFLVTGTQPPKWIASTADILAGMTIPLMLITLGISLAKLQVRSLKRSLGLSLLRLALGFAVGLAIAEALGLEGLARGVLVLQSAMPVAVFNYLFAQRYDTEPEEVAGMVVISTTLSFATLPALLWYLL